MFVPNVEDEREKERALIHAFDQTLFERLVAEDVNGNGGYISIEKFREQLEAFAQAHEKSSLNLLVYQEWYAQPRLHHRLFGAADGARHNLALSPGLTRHLVASTAIVHALHALINEQNNRDE